MPAHEFPHSHLALCFKVFLLEFGEVERRDGQKAGHDRHELVVLSVTDARLAAPMILHLLHTSFVPANTRSPEAPAAADIHLHVSPRAASASVCTAVTWAARLPVSAVAQR